MQPIAVAKRYARALADSAGGNDSGRLDAVASELSLAAKVLGADAKFAHFFADHGLIKALPSTGDVLTNDLLPGKIP